MAQKNPSLPVELALAEVDDLEAILPMVREYHQFDHLEFEEVTIKKLLRSLLENPALGRLWKVRYQEETIGYLLLTFGYSLEYQGRDAFIDEFYLKEHWRTQGLGNQTMELFKKEAQELGLKAIHLEVERKNQSAVGLYRKHGFKEPDRAMMTLWMDGRS